MEANFAGEPVVGHGQNAVIVHLEPRELAIVVQGGRHRRHLRNAKGM
jgi:hypothetical protein